MFMRWVLVPVLLVLAIIFFLKDTSNETAFVPPIQGLPWQIALDANGSSTVFGITLGKSRLADALQTLGNDMELAIIAAPKKLGNLEMYYGHYRAGILTGKLILQADASEDQLVQWRERSIKQKIMPTGEARKFTLTPEDVPDALQTVVHSITFIPAIRLDEEIVIGRFGEPDQRIQTEESVVHYLYAELGLAVTVSSEVKDVMQYVEPDQFFRLEQPLLVIPPDSAP